MSKFTGPLQNADKIGGLRQWFQGLPIGQEPDLCVYFNDFLVAQDYAATDWVVTTTEAGAGDATEAIAADEACGALLITNDAADNDLDALQSAEETWRLTAGKQTWFETRLKISDADQMDLFVGLSITDTTALASTDQCGFLLADGSAALSAVTLKDSAGTTTSSVATLADSTYVKLGFHYDGISKIKYFVNRSLVATHTTGIPDNENLALTIHVQNGEAVAKTCTIDYFYVAQER